MTSEAEHVDREATTIGGVTWHTSEPEGGPPDVGISIYLGPEDRLWGGEISRSMFEECGADEYFDNDFGWFLVRYNPGPDIIAHFADVITGQAFMEQLAAWIRAAQPKA